MRTKIAYQGVQGSFSEMAIEKQFGPLARGIGKVTFEEVFQSLTHEEVNLAALPIENTLIGPIVENLDLLDRYEVSIVHELCLPIEHCLVARKGVGIEAIKKVYSHPKALSQCSLFFEQHPWIEKVAHFDTAGAAQEIAQQEHLDSAAIASGKTAAVYGLEIVKRNLEDHLSNTTRFLFLKKGKNPEFLLKKKGKCSLLFTLKHEPGSLARVLKVLSDQGFNLTQIVSRPIWEKPFEYLFFVDLLFFDGIDGIESLKDQTETLKILGVYEPF